jgi:hypothetical protein
VDEAGIVVCAEGKAARCKRESIGRQYGLEELRHYIERSRVAIDKLRGWEFSAKADFPEKTVGELQAFAAKKGTWA